SAAREEIAAPPARFSSSRMRCWLGARPGAVTSVRAGRCESAFMGATMAGTLCVVKIGILFIGDFPTRSARVWGKALRGCGERVAAESGRPRRTGGRAIPTFRYDLNATATENSDMTGTRIVFSGLAAAAAIGTAAFALTTSG